MEPVTEPAGTMNEALNEPVVLVVTGVGIVAIVEPPSVIVTVELALKPEPETATVELTIPEDGLRAIICVMVKAALPLLVPSEAWTV